MFLPTRYLPLAALASAAMLLLPAPASAKSKPPRIPAAVQVPAGHKAFMSLHAAGVQIYACDGSAWTFVAPRANLRDDRGKRVMTHFAGPTWKHKDGSTVVAEVAANSPAPKRAKTIPWLLLTAKSTTAGALAKTAFIQRLQTTGGVMPAASKCNAKTAGTQREVPYTAVYVFWKAKRA